MFIEEMSEPGRGEGGRYHLHREVFLGLMILQLIEESVIDGESKMKTEPCRDPCMRAYTVCGPVGDLL